MPRLFIYSKLALQIKPIHSAKWTQFTILNSEAFLGLGFYNLEMLFQKVWSVIVSEQAERFWKFSRIIENVTRSIYDYQK